MKQIHGTSVSPGPFLLRCLVVFSVAVACAAVPALAQGNSSNHTQDLDHDRGDSHDKDKHFQFVPGSLVVSRSVYEGKASTVTIGEALPLGCQGGLTGLTVNVPLTAGGTTPVTVPCGVASDNGEYPNLFDTHNVWNNAGSDGSFGVTSPIFLDDITTDGSSWEACPSPPTRL